MTTKDTNPPEQGASGTKGRDGYGRYTRTIDTAERDAKAARLRADGWEYRDIANTLGLSVSNAYEAVQRILKATIQEPAEDLRQAEAERVRGSIRRLKEMRETVLGVLKRKHYAISNGKLIYLGDQVLEDDDVILRAVAQLQGIEDRIQKASAALRQLFGLDIPVKQEIDVSGGVEYRIVGVAPEDLK